MHRPSLKTVCTVALATLLIYLAPTIAEQAAPSASAEVEPAEQDPADAAGEAAGEEADPDASADDVLEDLLRRRSENPLIEPARPRDERVGDREARPRSQAARAIEGIAPGAAEASLRREGQFVITRRGRMVRAPGDVSGWVFVFEADGSGMHDPPMYLMPCQLLEDMEQIVQQHGDAVVFILSGQIYLYRDANYLLPTLMQIAPDRGNLGR